METAVELLSKMLGDGVFGVGDTPLTVLTNRAPAVLKKCALEQNISFNEKKLEKLLRSN